MSEKLLPCPFCGSVAVWDKVNGWDAVTCTNNDCDASAQIYSSSTWNTRTTQQQLVGELDERIMPEVYNNAVVDEYNNVRLKVGCQSFTINGEMDDAAHAEWTANMLRIALTNLIKPFLAINATPVEE